MITDTNSENKQPHAQDTSALPALLCPVCQKIEAQDKTIEMLLTRMQNLENKYATLEKRQSYLEFDLHSENGNLKDEKLGLWQQYGLSED